MIHIAVYVLIFPSMTSQDKSQDKKSIEITSKESALELLLSSVQTCSASEFIAWLDTTFHVKTKYYEDHGLFVLNYDQIRAPPHHYVTDICRGLIIHKSGQVRCRSFDRFYNGSETVERKFLEDEKNWPNCLVQEKADGSLIRIYYLPETKRWEIATRGTAFAEGPVHTLADRSQKFTFRDLALEAAGFPNKDTFQTWCKERYRPAMGRRRFARRHFSRMV